MAEEEKIEPGSQDKKVESPPGVPAVQEEGYDELQKGQAGKSPEKEDIPDPQVNDSRPNSSSGLAVGQESSNLPSGHTDTTTSETKQMEVHHHTHAGHGKKSWKNYFWEFLMLFLAVFCGFLAEYQLEHKIEKDREKQFVQSLVRDVKKDITQGNDLQGRNFISQKLCDSLLVALSGKEISNNSYPAYAMWSSITGFTDFIPNEGTIQQLKNSGSLRLLRKQEVVDRLMEYNKVLELIKIHQGAMNSFLFQDIKKTELFDVVRLSKENDRVNIPLLSNERKLLSWGYQYLSIWKSLLATLNNYFEIVIKRGNELLESVNKEYHIN